MLEMMLAGTHLQNATRQLMSCLSYSKWRGSQKLTELQIALSGDNTDKVRDIVNAMRQEDDKALQDALDQAILANDDSIENMEILIKLGANVNAKHHRFYNEPPLQHAVARGDKLAVEFLLSKGADVNIKNGVLATPLSYVSTENGKEIAKILIKHGANVNVTDSRGWTPLTYAVYNKNEKVEALLRSKGAHE